MGKVLAVIHGSFLILTNYKNKAIGAIGPHALFGIVIKW